VFKWDGCISGVRVKVDGIFQLESRGLLADLERGKGQGCINDVKLQGLLNVEANIETCSSAWNYPGLSFRLSHIRHGNIMRATAAHTAHSHPAPFTTPPGC